MTLAESRQNLTRIQADIEAAGQALDAGKPICLAGLTSAVAAVCAGATALPANEARTLLPAMQQVIEALEQLAAKLGGRPEQDAGKATQDPARAQRLHAARAYGKGFR